MNSSHLNNHKDNKNKQNNNQILPLKPKVKVKTEFEILKEGLNPNKDNARGNLIWQEELNKIKEEINKNKEELSLEKECFERDLSTESLKNELNPTNTNSNKKFNLHKHNISHLNKNSGNLNVLPLDIKKFNKFPLPKNKREIKAFVNNIINYANFYINNNLLNSQECFDNILFLKIQIETEYNDFKNKGLEIEYFKKKLLNIQDEVVNSIKNIQQYKNISNNESLSDESVDKFVDIQSNYSLLLQKRKRKVCLNDIKSITSDSSSSNESILNDGKNEENIKKEKPNINEKKEVIDEINKEVNEKIQNKEKNEKRDI